MAWQAELPFALERTAEGETPRTIALGDRIVPYTLRRARRRTIGLTIDHRGLRVGAPHRAALSDVETLIRKHGDWVAQKLDEWRDRRRPTPLHIAEGTQLPYFGGRLQLRITTGNTLASWTQEDLPTLTLRLRSPDDAERLLGKALRQKALEFFTPRLAHHAARFGITAPRLTLSSARTRWGSCSLKTGIRLNWRLLHFPEHIIDYVIVHELAHLREMNHGHRFWAIVDHYCPDYRLAREALKTLSGTLPALA